MRAVSCLSLCALLTTCHVPPTVLEQVLEAGELRVVTRNSPATYYLGADRPLGLEYDLVRGFADSLGVQLTIYTLDNIADIVPEVVDGRAQIAAAGLTVTPERETVVDFGPAYREVTQQVVYRNGERRPRSIADLYDQQIEVLTGSSHAEMLSGLHAAHPELTWHEQEMAAEHELLERVSDGELDVTIADSSAVELNRYFHPEVRVAFDLTEPQPIAWALRKTTDSSLRDAVNDYFARLRSRGAIRALQDRYYGHADDFDYVGARTFLKHIERRLPAYRVWFQEAADSIDKDWRLLAAMAYQESHWDPRAVSPTGVRGLMMLTSTTARSLGIADREDPRQSIQGGARYLRRVFNRIPDRIREPDRTWMALAAYNVGWGHLEDARIITEIRGGDPDRWRDVRDSLPLLSQKKWYSRVRRGYARGWEPVNYVDNIRNYYEVLVWLTAADPEEPVRADNDPPEPLPRLREPDAA